MGAIYFHLFLILEFILGKSYQRASSPFKIDYADLELLEL
jgi:hypothetical protein